MAARLGFSPQTEEYVEPTGPQPSGFVKSAPLQPKDSKEVEFWSY
jgi:hypothetical protein